MKKPVIGVIPLFDDEKDSYWMLPGYMLGLEAAGALPVMLPLTTDTESLEQLFEGVDGLLLTGGHDVAPEVYHEQRSSCCGPSCPARDSMEKILFELALKHDKPVLGICRGLQLINALLGGTLYQDLPTEHPSVIEHHQQPPYSVPCHEVVLIEGSPLSELLGLKAINVNSYHHQAVKKLAESLCVMALAEDGLVEAAYEPTKKFVWAVQWHPEFMYREDVNSRKIFASFVAAAKELGRH